MKDYLDYLMEVSRFSEFRWRRESTELFFSGFVAEAAAVCLETKRKYDFSGESITPEKAVDICLIEGFCIDVEIENGFERKSSWFGISDDRKPLLWIHPATETEKGQFILIDFLAVCLLPKGARDLILDCKENLQTVEEFCENPPLLKAVMKADLINAMLRANQSEGELSALQAVEKQVGESMNVRGGRVIGKIRNLSPEIRERFLKRIDETVETENDAESLEVWKDFKSILEKEGEK